MFGLRFQNVAGIRHPTCLSAGSRRGRITAASGRGRRRCRRHRAGDCAAPVRDVHLLRPRRAARTRNLHLPRVARVRSRGRRIVGRRPAAQARGSRARGAAGGGLLAREAPARRPAIRQCRRAGRVEAARRMADLAVIRSAARSVDGRRASPGVRVGRRKQTTGDERRSGGGKNPIQSLVLHILDGSASLNAAPGIRFPKKTGNQMPASALNGPSPIIHSL